MSDSQSIASLADRFAALSRTSVALMSELDETRLLHLIAETARDLTGAAFAAFSIRPVNEQGQPLVPAEGNQFHLAAVLGVTREQEELFRHTPLGGEGLLAPIFRYGVPVRVDDAIKQMYHQDELHHPQTRQASRDAAFAFAHGQAPSETLRSMGTPRGHPLIRSFLGAPLLNRAGEVRGGLLLGHTQPAQFSQDDETLLVGLAAQAAVALENARLYRLAHTHAQELDAVFESITDGVILVDPQGHIRRENASARHLRTLLEHLPDGAQSLDELVVYPACKALAEQRSYDQPIALPTGDGETRLFFVSATPLHAPTQTLVHIPTQTHQPEEVVVVLHDVTETHSLLLEQREHAETETRRAFLQHVLDEIPNSVYLVGGADARLLLANRATHTNWGATWPVGMPYQMFLEQYDICVFDADGHRLPFEQLASIRAVREHQPVTLLQEFIRHPDDARIPMLVNAVVLDQNLFTLPLTADQDQELKPVVLVVHQDISALKEAEHIKDDFIAIAAHELRNPLAILKGFAQTLIRESTHGHGPPLTDWQQEALQGIDLGTRRLVELTDDLLDVTRLQAGRLELHLEAVNIVPLVRRVVARLQTTTMHQTLNLAPMPEALVAQLDPRRMEQVLTNVIGNAIKYSPIGGTINIRFLEDGTLHQATIAVEDQGMGIPANQQAQIFGRFVRGENVQMQGISGTGLGLYLCHELMDRLQGRIWFASTEGEGTTFFIQIPLLALETET